MGFASVTGDPIGTVMFADNVSFDGTVRGGTVTLDGQFLIGSTALPHIRPGFITSTGGTIAITKGSGTVNMEVIIPANILPYTRVTHAMTPYTLATTDDYVSCDTSGGVITVKLANGPATGRVFVIKDFAGTSAASNITITTVGGAVTIDGATSYTLNTNYTSVQLIFNGTSYEVY